MTKGILMTLSDSVIQNRREWVFLTLSGVFLGAMAMLNVIGITKFIQLGPFEVAVGVLPYPITFLCTDLIGELYGKRKASQLIWVGLLVNLLILSIMWLGDKLPPVDPASQPSWQNLSLAKEVHLPDGSKVQGSVELFHILYSNTAGVVFASMLAYLTAQFCDVQLFHFWKKLTRGKHLWLRNNLSTLFSQLVDSLTVVSITFGAAFFRGDMALELIFSIFLGNYSFKMFAAMLDTLPFYLGVHKLKKFLALENSMDLEGNPI